MEQLRDAEHDAAVAEGGDGGSPRTGFKISSLKSTPRENLEPKASKMTAVHD
jgi:hypothetical protein